MFTTQFFQPWKQVFSHQLLGFTGQVISAMLDVAGWATPWDTDNVRELNDAMALLDTQGSYGDAQL